MEQAAATPGFALSRAYNKKMARHGDECQQTGVKFVPLPWETLCGWHSTTVDEVGKILTALARHTGAKEGVTFSPVSQRISILLTKANSALLLNRVPAFPLAHMEGIVE